MSANMSFPPHERGHERKGEGGGDDHEAADGDALRFELMGIELDHLIVPVNDAGPSVDFFVRILGCHDEGERPPFSVVRVTPELTLQLAPWGTDGGWHLAFAMSRGEFDNAFGRVRAAGIDYGDSFHEVGNMRGPGQEAGSRGMADSVYFFDPNGHLIEIRCYERSSAD
jgi:catechol 2,3-dioxygenase-like lactoylglutathione lyase family enzyme